MWINPKGHGCLEYWKYSERASSSGHVVLFSRHFIAAANGLILRKLKHRHVHVIGFIGEMCLGLPEVQGMASERKQENIYNGNKLSALAIPRTNLIFKQAFTAVHAIMVDLQGRVLYIS